MPKEVPKDSNFIKELQWINIVVLAFRNQDNKLELSTWAYHKEEDARRRFEKVMEYHKLAGAESLLISTETHLVGIYESFEQSEFVNSGEGQERKH